jgi:molybdopterin-containing oxidoreductase family iron-sulfur binding subunit
MIKPSEQANVIAALLKGLNKDTSGVSAKLRGDVQKVVDLALKSLKKSKGESLVVCGSNDKNVQLLVNKLNYEIGAYKHTININNPLNLFQSNDKDMNKFIDDVINGNGPETVIFYGTNPVYTHPRGKELGKALSKIKNKFSLSMHADETAGLCDIIVPDHHILEGWNDYSPTKQHYSIAQPTIRPLGYTFSAIESVLVWAGKRIV